MTFDWTAPDGELFPCEEWKAESGPRGVLVCVHGLSGAATDFSALAGAAVLAVKGSAPAEASAWGP